MSLTELTLILVVALILFGPEDLPVVARALGKIVYQVRKYTNEISKELKDAIDAPANTINSVLRDTAPKQKPASAEKNDSSKEVLLSYEEDSREDPSENTKEATNPLAELPSTIVSAPKETQAGE